MRLIDGDKLIEELHNVIFEDCDDRETVYKVIERQPMVCDNDLIMQCKELKAHVEYLRRQNDSMKGEIKALAFAVRCGGISGNEVAYETD